MKKIILLAMSIILLSGCRESLEEQAARNCKEFTEKNCPTPVQLNIRMDSMVYENTTRTIRYYYTLSGPADNEKAAHKMQKELRSLLLTAVKSDTGTKIYKDAGFNFRYTYRSEKSPATILFDTTFGAKDH